MDVISGFGYSLGAFLVLLTVLVFVHEMGHYLVARRNGVRVEIFSIGFGPEIFGWTDRYGTRWKFSWVPLGGYVKMFGDADMASAGEVGEMSPQERAVSFHGKSVRQRAAIVFAGPAINYVFAVLVWAALFVVVGETFTPPEVSAVQPDSAAAEAGMRPGDRILAIDGGEVQRFEDVQQIVRLNPGNPLEIRVARDGEERLLTVTPQESEFTDRFGNTHRIGLLGVSYHYAPVIGTVVPGGAADRAGLAAGDVVLAIDGVPADRFDALSVAARENPGRPLELTVERGARQLTLSVIPAPTEVEDADGPRLVGVLGVGPERGERLRYNPAEALWQAVSETGVVTGATFRAIGQMFAGTRTTEELGGPIKIAQMSGQMAQGGIYSFFWFMAFISLNLCLINLLPVPMLDGGHLLYYGIEWVRGRPLGQRAQEYGFRIGLALVLTLMVFVTWNDLVNLQVFEFVRSLV